MAMDVTLTGNPLWARAIGGSAFDVGSAVAVDENDQVGGKKASTVAVAGTVEGDINLGPPRAGGVMGYDVFFAKFASDGQPVWSYRYGSAAEERALAVAVALDGSVIVAGYFKSRLSLGGAELVSAGDGDVFVAKYTRSGEHKWSRRFGGTGNDAAQALAVDDQGNIAVTGYCSDGCDLGRGPQPTAGKNDVFVLKLSSTGQPLWSRIFGSPNSDIGLGIVVDRSARISVVGGYSGTLDPGSGPLASIGKDDAFIAQYGADGMPLWGRNFGGSGNDAALTIALDPGGDLLVGGAFNETMTVARTQLQSSGAEDAFVLRLSATGEERWARGFGGPGSDAVTGLAIDRFGIVLGGYFTDRIDLGGGPLRGAGLIDFLVARLDASGRHLWSKGFGGPASDAAMAVASTSTGVVATGYLQESLDPGTGPVTSAGSYDLFLWRSER